jgi:hypothetical protein
MPVKKKDQTPNELRDLTIELLRVSKRALMLRSIESSIVADPSLPYQDRQRLRNEGYKIETDIRSALKRAVELELIKEL